jgi:hypothetical protein
MFSWRVIAFGRRSVSGERSIGQAFYNCRISIVGSGTWHMPRRQAIPNRLYNLTHRIGCSVLTSNALGS